MSTQMMADEGSVQRVRRHRTRTALSDVRLVGGICFLARVLFPFSVLYDHGVLDGLPFPTDNELLIAGLTAGGGRISPLRPPRGVW